MEFALIVMSLYLACIPEIILSGGWKYPYFTKGFLVYSAKVALAGPNESIPEAEYLALKLSDRYGMPTTEFKRHTDDEVLFRDNLVSWHIRISITMYRGIIRVDRENKTLHIKGFLNWFVLIYMIVFGVFFYNSIFFWLVVMLVSSGNIFQISRIKKELADYY